MHFNDRTAIKLRIFGFATVITDDIHKDLEQKKEKTFEMIVNILLLVNFDE